MDKPDALLCSILLGEDRFLFCDETTGLVKVLNTTTGKFEYRKMYIWDIKNPALKVAYYLYDRGSRSMEVADKSLKDFLVVSLPMFIMFTSCLTVIWKELSSMVVWLT